MFVFILGPPEPVAGLRVTGNCAAAYNKTSGPAPVLRWIKGEELGVETRRFYIEYATEESAEQGQCFLIYRGFFLKKKSLSKLCQIINRTFYFETF